ncbi:MAG TPA: hypothetical protein PLZ43_16315, partial [bacterium]|nr:hypothetical protein [bacterium]
MWLNWKYATSLDAVKIILGDVHDFSYPPRARGERKCVKTEYTPFIDDPILGKICYREFETNETDALMMGKIKSQVRGSWVKKVTEMPDDTFCTGTDTFTFGIDTDILPPAPDSEGPSVLSSALSCDICRDKEGVEVPCKEYVANPLATVTDDDVTISGVTATVNYSCCVNYECTNPKCRDDDTSCRSAGLGCILGYYSDFDQDQNHCCDMLDCVEPDPSGCGSGGTFLPGPGNDVTVQFEDDLEMPVLGADEYQDVMLTAEISKLAFSVPKTNVEKVIISIYYGCNVAGETPANKIAEKTYNSEPVVPDAIISTKIDLTGCEKSGYKVGGTMQIFHSGGVSFTPAEVEMDIVFYVSYTSGSEQDIYVLNNSPTGSRFYYYEYRSEATGAAGDKVNEYECKTTFYHKQSLVVNGGPGSCPAKHPAAERCTEPDHTVIAADQWGNAKKTACSWLCRDQVVYDDTWKCRAFFSQMDNPARGGTALCVGVCPGDNPDTLDDCCGCINRSSYTFNSLEPPERVKFVPGPPIPNNCPGGICNCSVSGYEEGITSDGTRTYTSGYMAEVITGHIKELGDSSYRLNVAGYISPYEDSSNKWYSSATL